MPAFAFSPKYSNRIPDLAGELVTELLLSGDRSKELIGAWLIFWESFRNDGYIEEADELTAESIDHRRLMADVAAKAFTWVDNRHRAEHLLRDFFFDSDEQVRKQAAQAFREIKPNDVERYKELTGLFLKSPAFGDDGFAV